jgi:putative tryptophan/tyrosine transport system substrate-binding protein
LAADATGSPCPPLPRALASLANDEPPRIPDWPAASRRRAARQNLAVERRWAEGRAERYQELAAELVALKPDVIVAATTPSVSAAKRATSTIPIVMTLTGDPVGVGLIASLARPRARTSPECRFRTALS